MADNHPTDARIDAKLAELGLALPQAAAPVAAYVPVVIVPDGKGGRGQEKRAPGDCTWMSLPIRHLFQAILVL